MSHPTELNLMMYAEEALVEMLLIRRQAPTNGGPCMTLNDLRNLPGYGRTTQPKLKASQMLALAVVQASIKTPKIGFSLITIA